MNATQEEKTAELGLYEHPRVAKREGKLVVYATDLDLQRMRERCSRLRSIRNSLHLPRRVFEEKYGIPPGTMQNWESPRYGGFGESGAHRIAHAFLSEGVQCDVNWLLYGVGQKPKIPTPMHRVVVGSGKVDLPDQELELFRQLYKETLDWVIRDDALAPWLEVGDVVAGRCFRESNLRKGIGSLCIIELSEEHTVVRMLLGVDDEGMCRIDWPQPNLRQFTAAETVKPLRIAPVQWIRKWGISL